MPKYPAVPGLTGSTLKQKQRIVGLLKKVCVDVRTSNVIISRCCLAQNELKYLLYVFFRHSSHKSNSNNNRFINGLSVVVADRSRFLLGSEEGPLSRSLTSRITSHMPAHAQLTKTPKPKIEIYSCFLGIVYEFFDQP